MTLPRGQHNQGSEVLGYLGVDRFMATMLQAEALAAAFEIGLIDCLISRGPATSDVLAERIAATPRGMAFLIDILTESGVVEDHEGACRLGHHFMEAIRFRELMELKLALANLAARDMLGGFTDLVMRPGQFMSDARVHRLFAYDHCLEDNQANRKSTSQWMQVTTALTRYESAVCMRHHDFSRCRRILDVGGNSGELALRLCRNYPDLKATVFDLPLVCELGREHVAGEPEAGRIFFEPGNALTDDFPGTYDLITFKSMLHDWPDDEARQLVEKASRALKPGGQILIFERAPVVAGKQRLTHATLPFLIFFHSYRRPETYAGFMERSGLSGILTRTVELEMTFMLVTGRLLDTAAGRD